MIAFSVSTPPSSLFCSRICSSLPSVLPWLLSLFSLLALVFLSATGLGENRLQQFI